MHIFETRILPGSSRPDAAKQWLGRLRTHAFPVIGGKQLHTIASSDLLAVLEPSGSPSLRPRAESGSGW